MLDDQQLLQQYANDGSEAAFGELVARYVNLVYSAALRRAGGDAQLAQDAAQLVFADLARKARALPKNVVLTGWLHRATYYAAVQLLRTERRRLAHEQEAAAVNALESEPTPNWDQIRPLLDEALDRLNHADRNAVLLRFFEQRSLAEVGRALGTNEDAVRKRVSRALEKLRTYLVRRGITTTTAALSMVISTNAVQAAPVGLATTLTGGALAGAVLGSRTTFAFLKLVSMTKLKAGIVSAAVIGSLTTTVVIQQQIEAKTQKVDISLHQQSEQLAQVQEQNGQLSNLLFQANGPNSVAALEKLREEVAGLRSQTNELAALRNEHRRLLASLAKVREDLLGPDVQDFDPGHEGSNFLSAKEEYCIKLDNAFSDYAQNHQNRYPTNMEELKPFLSEDVRNDTNFSLSQFEIVFQGTWADAFSGKYAHPSKIILYRERQPWESPDGKLVKFYEMIQGQKGYVSPPDGNFEAWEEQHIVTPEPSKP